MWWRACETSVNASLDCSPACFFARSPAKFRRRRNSKSAACSPPPPPPTWKSLAHLTSSVESHHRLRWPSLLILGPWQRLKDCREAVDAAADGGGEGCHFCALECAAWTRSGGTGFDVGDRCCGGWRWRSFWPLPRLWRDRSDLDPPISPHPHSLSPPPVRGPLSFLPPPRDQLMATQQEKYQSSPHPPSWQHCRCR